MEEALSVKHLISRITVVNVWQITQTINKFFRTFKLKKIIFTGIFKNMIDTFSNFIFEVRFPVFIHPFGFVCTQ